MLCMRGYFIDGPWQGKQMASYSAGVTQVRVPHSVVVLNEAVRYGLELPKEETYFALYELTPETKEIDGIICSVWKFMKDTYADGSDLLGSGPSNFVSGVVGLECNPL